MYSLQDEQQYLKRQFRGLLIALTLVIGIVVSTNLTSFIATDFSATLYGIMIANILFICTIALLWWLFRANRLSVASLVCSVVAIVAPLFSLTQTSAQSNWIYVVLMLVLAPVFALPYVGNRTFRGLCLIVGVIGWSVIGFFASTLLRDEMPIALITDDMLSAGFVISVILFLLWQFSRQHHLLTSSLRRRNAELGDLQSDLEQQVASRTAELEQTLTSLQARTAEQQRLLDQLQQQQALIQQLSVPMLPISAATLVLPLVGSLDPARLDLIRERALAILEQQHARTLVLDLTGVPEVDTQAAQGLLDVARATYLMGSTCVLAGMRPELAQTLVTLGVDLRSLRTFATLQRALDVVG